MVAVIGNRKSGKTIFIEALVKELVKRRYKVGTVKHIHHRDFALDTPGKDTWRHTKAGAKSVVCISPNEISIIRRINSADNKLDNFLGFLLDEEIDVLIIEGFRRLLEKNEKIPKIITAKTENEAKEILRESKNVIGVSLQTTTKEKVLDIPCFGTDKVEKLVDFLEELWKPQKIFKSLPKLDCGLCGFNSCFEHAKAISEGKSTIKNCPVLFGGAVSITFNGKTIPLNKFLQDLVRNTVLGLVSTLKGVRIKGGETLTISVYQPNLEE